MPEIMARASTVFWLPFLAPAARVGADSDFPTVSGLAIAGNSGLTPAS